jgi:hypothetical protein
VLKVGGHAEWGGGGDGVSVVVDGGVGASAGEALGYAVGESEG